MNAAAPVFGSPANWLGLALLVAFVVLDFVLFRRLAGRGISAGGWRLAITIGLFLASTLVLILGLVLLAA